MDNNLFLNAKGYLGETYRLEGEYDRAMEIFKENLKEADTLDDQIAKAKALLCLGKVY